MHIGALPCPRFTGGRIASHIRAATDTLPELDAHKSPMFNVLRLLAGSMNVSHNVSKLTDCLYFRACTLVPCPVLASLAVGRIAYQAATDTLRELDARKRRRYGSWPQPRKGACLVSYLLR